MPEKKRGRPKKQEVEVWERKYYRLSDARDNQAIRTTLEERIFKAYEDLHILAFDRNLNQYDVGTVNKVVGAILDRI